MANTDHGREFTEQEIRDRAAAFDQQFGANANEFLNGRPVHNAELVRSTNEMLRNAGDRAELERTFERFEQQEIRELFAAGGGWVPGNPTEDQRQEYRADYARRQEWSGLVEGGTVAANPQDRTVQDLKPPAELTKQEIVIEARELHAHFQQPHDRFEAATGEERLQLREEMKPLVVRENELREEYTGRVKAEMNPNQLSQDQVPEQSIGYAR